MRFICIGVIREDGTTLSFAFVMAITIFCGSNTTSAPLLLMIFIFNNPFRFAPNIICYA